jgi:uncharacterized 2Fe-2S/4Fe-4S cluster protein (DUF4445 family)
VTAHTIDFEPLGRRGKCQSSESLLDCALRVGVRINSLCGGRGQCRCGKVQVLSGAVSEPTSNELDLFSPRELREGWRLACQTYAASDCKIRVPPESMSTPQRVQVEGFEVVTSPEPPVRGYDVKVTAASLSDPTADGDRLLECLNRQYQLKCDKIDIEVQRELSPMLRSSGWQCLTSVRNSEVVGVFPREGRQLGLAVDLGTTKVAAYLVDLTSGETLSARGIMNPQIAYGEDIITRMTAVMRSPDEGTHLQNLVIEAVNGLALELCTEVGAGTNEIVEAVVVGNTAMHHLFLALPVKQLALAPYVPAVSMSIDIKARNLSLNMASGAYVHLLPNVAGFIGSDHVAMLLAIEAQKGHGPMMALDIGTNTEVSLIHQGKISAVSCASGPVFEGGHVTDGMRAAKGAIEKIIIDSIGVQYQTVDGGSPAGICGSGILDAMAQLYRAEVIDKSGRFKGNHPRVRKRGKLTEFVLVSKEERNGGQDIVITQGDVRKLQLGKAAIRTGIEILLKTNGCSEEEIKEVIIAGAFGSYVDISSAITIGMFPAIPLDLFRQVGNAAGTGARQALISLTKRAQSKAIASLIHYIELAGDPRFKQIFVQTNYIGRYKIQEGKMEEID